VFSVADLIAMLKQQQLEIAKSLAEGNASSWEAYQRLVGEHVGLEKALISINQILEDAKNVE
jgi:hypothetical protein